MKLVFDIVMLLFRYGWGIVATLVAMFVLFLLRIPFTDAWHEAEQARARLPEIVQQIEELDVRRAQLEHDLHAWEGSARALDGQVWQLEGSRIPGAEQVVQSIESARQQAEEQANRARTALDDRLSRAVGFGRPPFDPSRVTPSEIAGWVDGHRREIRRRCDLSVLSLEYWERPIDNATYQWGCDQAEQRLAALEAWSEGAISSLEQVAAARAQLESLTAQWELRQSELASLRTAASDATAALQQAQSERERAASEQARVLAELEQAQVTQASLEARLSGISGWMVGLGDEWERYRGWLWEQWRWFWPRGLTVLVLVWLVPYAWRAGWYWLGAPMVSRTRPLELVSHALPGEVVLYPSERTCAVEIGPGQDLIARAAHVRQIESGMSRTRFFYDRAFPFLSYASGLWMLTEIRLPEGRTQPTRLTIAGSGAASADAYLMQVDLRDHPGFVVHPRHVVALTSGLRLKALWRWNLHAWIRGQFRYLLLEGTGSVWFEGFGDVHAQTLEGRETHQEGNAYLAFDGRLETRARRTETFWPYLLGQVPLFESGLSGHGSFLWQKSASATGATPLHRAWDTFWGALGKFIGL